ncbi:four helix bundle protein [Thermodesulfovibrio hydrogeniphilus]
MELLGMRANKDNIILERAFKFAVKVVNICRFLMEERKEFVLSKQLLKSGTSIGANINEAQNAQSKKDFIAKMSIASKEAMETKYWLNLLIETGYLNNHDKMGNELLSDIEEIQKILISIIKTSQNNNRKNNAK